MFFDYEKEAEKERQAERDAQSRRIRSKLITCDGACPGDAYILVDKLTGVNYLLVEGTGMTVLVDADGKPIVTNEQC